MPISIDPVAKTPIASELQKLAPDAIIELFVLDLSPLGGGLYYFHAGTNQLTQPIVWQGITYSPLPIMVEGFNYEGSGALPRPKLKIANVTKIVSAFVVNYDDLVGAKITRHRTFAKFLDGQPGANPNIYFPAEHWYVDRKTNENKLLIEWELSSPFDTEGVMIPARIVVPGTCSWKYRGDGCGYTGTAYFKTDDTPTADVNEDSCGKKFASCKKRFGNILPFGGFPGVKGY